MEPLRVRNFRLLLISQGISVAGSLLQDVAVVWLVLHLTHGYTALGLVVAFQFAPMLAFGAWGGVLSDRFDRRRLLFVTDAVGGVLALILAILVFTNAVEVWEIYLLALLLGFATLVNQPAGQSILGELVGEDLLPKAIGLTLSSYIVAKGVGSIAGGILVATVGFGPCFLVNAATFLVSLACLAAIRPAEMHPVAQVPHQRTQVRSGLRYVWATHNVKITLLLLSIMGILCFNFTINLAALSKGAFAAGPAGFAILFACWGIGGGAGSLLAARKSTPDLNRLGWLGVLFGVSSLALAAAPTLIVADGVSVIVGVLTFWVVAASAELLQVSSRPEMRGRVMALWVVVVWGSFAIGSPLMSWVANSAGPRAPLVVCGVAALASCGIWLLWARHQVHEHEHELPGAVYIAAVDGQADHIAATDRRSRPESEV